MRCDRKYVTIVGIRTNKKDEKHAESKRKKLLFLLYGCKVNQYETNAMEQMLLMSGYQIVPNDLIADVYVVNTCTVTNVAERKSRQMIRRAKQMNPNALILVCGCYVEVSRQEVEDIKEVDLVLSEKEKKDIVNKIEQLFIEKEQHDRLFDHNLGQNDDQKKEETTSEYTEYGAVTYTEKSRAVIKIQDGCNMFCSYCIIPYARGRIRSRQIDNVVEEVKKIAQKGIKEVVLTGIHIASYGKDREDSKVELIDLLEAIHPIPGIERIRLGSLEPTIITDEFLTRLVKLNKICHHFHLSLQSGDDHVLKRMNRKYTTKQFQEICNQIRQFYPDVNLTTDIIVGFPGETEEEFSNTYQFLSQIQFYKMHVFKYSPRKGTIAEKMPNQIDGMIKEKRSEKLIQLSNQNQVRINHQYIGKKLQVLIEEIENGYLKGHTSHYMEVKIPDGENHHELVNQMIEVMIIECDENTMELVGKIC